MLTLDDIKVFRKGGFTEIEIGAINEGLRQRPQTIDPRNEAWQQVFKDRLNYIRTKLNQGIPLKAIHDRITAFIIKSRENTPWDFLREAYPIKGGRKSDFSKRLEASTKIKAHFGGAYK